MIGRRRYVELPPYREPIAGAVVPDRECRICGCTDEDGCPDGCRWVPDPVGVGAVCSSCEEVVAGYPPAQGIRRRRALLELGRLP